ncbi:SIS domain-containing protein [Kiloniella laminariae]|uniref:SIS domain-containing protein n=1 Tax=Kiloniella laminariae TaxID=454162 RepID=UPI0003671E38|nr:SIS domain-containing protein [Kiloniella laminariae]
MDFQNYLDEVARICSELKSKDYEAIAQELLKLKKQQGRLFILGVGGSAANCSHAVNDFRKLCNIEAYAPVDNVSELTARTNDEGWCSVFVEWLKVSRLSEKDVIMIFSVGGGDAERNLSVNLIRAIDFARNRGAKIVSILGRHGGYAEKNSDRCIVVPTMKAELVTPLGEAFQAIIWHALVSDERLQEHKTVW